MRIIVACLIIFFTGITQAQDAVVALPSMNVLYIGIENEVEIVVNGYSTKELVKEITNGQVIERDGKTFLVVSVRGIATLKVGVKKKKNIEWLKEQEFRVRKIPEPQPMLGVLQDGETHTIQTIIANAQRIYMGLGDGFAAASVKSVVSKYSITLIDSFNYETFKVEGSLVSAAVQSKIRRLAAGGKIIISDVYYDVNYDGKPIVTNERCERMGNVVITVRPDISACSFDGGFYDTTAKVHYSSFRTNDAAFTDFVGKVKHGYWNYYTGYCPQRMWGQEYYDSGRLKVLKVWDSIGRLVLDVSKDLNADTMLWVEYYPNSIIKREGVVLTNNAGYAYEGELAEFKDKVSDNPALKGYSAMNFIPVGKWVEYYPNGAVRQQAYFAIVDGKTLDKYYYIEVEGSFPKAVVADGVWTTYDENGNLIAEFKYNKGFHVK